MKERKLFKRQTIAILIIITVSIISRWLNLAALAAMVVPNSVVAIKADANSMLDYFVVFVTSFGVVELDEQETSDFGHVYPRGSKVIKGHYLEYKKSTRKDLIFTRDSKAAIIPYQV